jgi:nitrate reductase NapE component
VPTQRIDKPFSVRPSPAAWPRWLLVACVLLPLLAVAALGAYSVVTSHQQHQRRAELLTQNLAVALQYSV